jgi:hypothetical protein
VGARAESSGEEIYDTGFQIIHRTGHLYRAIRLHFSEHRAVLANFSYRDFHILVRDSINKRVILRCPFASYVVAATAGLIFEPVRLPSSALSIAPLIAPTPYGPYDQNHLGSG